MRSRIHSISITKNTKSEEIDQDIARSRLILQATIADEPIRLLRPIEGYANEPLVTLEEACQSLVTVIDDLPTYVAIAKNNTHSPADDLSHDESASIYLYTLEWPSPDKSLYVILNRTLRNPGRCQLTMQPWFKYLKLFLTALAKLPPASIPDNQQVVYCGIKADISELYPSDSFVIWWGFASCTTSLDLIQSKTFLGITDNRTMFNIETTSARNISQHSRFKAEDEVLLMPATYMKVISRMNPTPQLCIINLKEEEPPTCILEPPFEGIHKKTL